MSYSTNVGFQVMYLKKTKLLFQDIPCPYEIRSLYLLSAT